MKKKKNDLTVRQLDVIRLVVHGDSNKIIAKKLCVTEHTVKAHLTQIYNKLEVTNRTAAAIKAKEDRIIPPQDSKQP